MAKLEGEFILKPEKERPSVSTAKEEGMEKHSEPKQSVHQEESKESPVKVEKAPIDETLKEDVPTETLNTKNVESHNHKHSTPRFFSAFSHYPKGFKFKDQENDEEVIIMARQHLITNLPWFLAFVLLAFVPPFAFLLFPLSPVQFTISWPLILLTIAIYYLIWFAFIVLNFAIWYFNIGLITNKRLIDIDVPNILVRILSEARLNAIQDVTITQVGGIRSIFNYGDVDIQTEGKTQNLEYYRVPKPNFIRTVIGNLILHRQ